MARVHASTSDNLTDSTYDGPDAQSAWTIAGYYDPDQSGTTGHQSNFGGGNVASNIVSFGPGGDPYSLYVYDFGGEGIGFFNDGDSAESFWAYTWSGGPFRFCLRRDGSSVRLWVDGSEVLGGSTLGSYTMDVGSGNGLSIASNQTAKVADLAFAHVAWTPAECAAATSLTTPTYPSASIEYGRSFDTGPGTEYTSGSTGGVTATGGSYATHSPVADPLDTGSSGSSLAVAATEDLASTANVELDQVPNAFSVAATTDLASTANLEAESVGNSLATAATTDLTSAANLELEQVPNAFGVSATADLTSAANVEIERIANAFGVAATTDITSSANVEVESVAAGSQTVAATADLVSAANVEATSVPNALAVAATVDIVSSANLEASQRVAESLGVSATVDLASAARFVLADQAAASLGHGALIARPRPEPQREEEEELEQAPEPAPKPVRRRRGSRGGKKKQAAKARALALPEPITLSPVPVVEAVRLDGLDQLEASRQAIEAAIEREDELFILEAFVRLSNQTS